jgi:hypothetical protein
MHQQLNSFCQFICSRWFLKMIFFWVWRRPSPKKIHFIIHMRQMNWFICGRRNSIIIHERRFEKFNFPCLLYNIFLLFCAFIYLFSILVLKIRFPWKIKLTFSVEKESQWTNVDDYHQFWMIIVQYGQTFRSLIYFSKIHLPQMIFSSEVDDISSMLADHHLQWLIIILSGWLSSPVVDYHLM